MNIYKFESAVNIFFRKLNRIIVENMVIVFNKFIVFKENRKEINNLLTNIFFIKN